MLTASNHKQRVLSNVFLTLYYRLTERSCKMLNYGQCYYEIRIFLILFIFWFISTTIHWHMFFSDDVQ